jgi:aminodeoxyfutalosine deaminase
MNPTAYRSALAALPKAELHLHLEGSIAPETVVVLAARRGIELSVEEVAARYRYLDFAGFLDAYKWVTSFLREPNDYRLIADELCERLLRQNVVYAEITISAGVMLRRGQDVAANFLAIRESGESAGKRGLRVQWIMDAVRQFGSEQAMETARWAVRLASEGVVAFGIGGDEVSIPASQFCSTYEFARAGGLHALAHAGEIGGPEVMREAIECLGVERIGHGLAAMHDPKLMDQLAESGLTLEVCPTSNLRTGALGRQLRTREARLEDHPLKSFFRSSLRLALSTDDPAMFQTDLLDEYEATARMGFSPADMARLAEMSFSAAFLPQTDREAYVRRVRQEAALLGLL